jgi:hypothetical protein
MRSNNEISVAELDLAVALALRAHARQRRKTSGLPYATHLAAVATLVASAGYARTVVAAAWLHDVIEDTDIVASDILNEVGGACPSPEVERLVRIVSELSEKKHNGDGVKLPWRVRKEEHLARMATLSEDAAAVKCADMVHNISTIVDDLKARGRVALSVFAAPSEDLLWYWRRGLEECERVLAQHLLPRVDVRLVDELQVVIGEVEVLIPRRRRPPLKTSMRTARSSKAAARLAGVSTQAVLAHFRRMSLMQFDERTTASGFTGVSLGRVELPVMTRGFVRKDGWRAATIGNDAVVPTLPRVRSPCQYRRRWRRDIVRDIETTS